MTALAEKRDYWVGTLDTIWAKASVPFLRISKGVEGPSGVVVTNNEAEFGYVELNDIPIKTYYNGWLQRKEPQEKAVDYAVEPAEINAERTVIFTPERMDIMPNTVLQQAIPASLLAVALFPLPMSSLVQKSTALQTEIHTGIEHQQELGQIDEELEDNVILAFPPPRKYSVDLIITKITKGKLRLIDTEDTL